MVPKACNLLFFGIAWGAASKPGWIFSLEKGLRGRSLWAVFAGTPVDCPFSTSLLLGGMFQESGTSCWQLGSSTQLCRCFSVDLLQQSHKVAIAFLVAWALEVDPFPAIFRAVCPCRKTSSFSSCNQDTTGSIAKPFSELPEEFHVAFPHLL